MRIRRPTVILILIVVGAVVLSLQRRLNDTLEEPAELVGRLWVSEGSDAPVLVHLVEEQRRRVYRSGSRSLISKTVLYSRHVLVVRQLPDGRVLAQATIAEVERNSARPKPELLGLAEGRAWIWDGTLTAFSLPDLTKNFTPESWGDRAAAVAELLPPNAEGFRVLPGGGHLVFRGRDARLHRINAQAGTIESISPELFPPTTLSRQREDRFVHYRPPQMSRITTSLSNLMQKSFRRPDGYWYGLLSESERNGLGQRVSVDDRPYGEVARTLYRLPYETDGRYAKIDAQRAETLGDLRLIQGGFLEQDFFEIWQVPEPASALALGRARLGADVPWELVRVALDGRVLWRTSTELADLYGYLPTARAVIMIGQRLPTSLGGPKADRREFVMSIDPVTGVRHEFDVAAIPAAPPVE